MRAGRPQRAGHRDVEGGVLVAVADAGLAAPRGPRAGSPSASSPGSRCTWRTRRSARSRGGAGAPAAFCASARISGASLSRKGSGRRKSARSAGAGPGRRSRGSRTSIVPPLADLPGSVEVGGVEGLEAVDAELQPARPCVGSSMRRGSRGHEGRGLQHVRLDRSRDREGLGLLRRLADDDEAHRALLAHDLADVRDPGARGDAGEAAPPRGRPERAARRRCTTSRAWTSRVIGALRRVAGSKTETCSVWPGWRPRAARTRGRLRERAGGSSSSRVSLRSPEGVWMREVEAAPVERARGSRSGPCPGRARTRTRWSAKARSTRRAARQADATCWTPRRVICSRPSSRIS